MTPEQDRMLRTVYSELTKRLDNRRGPNGAKIPDGGGDTILGYAANADGATYRASWSLADIQDALEVQEAMLTGLAERMAAFDAQLRTIAKKGS